MNSILIIASIERLQNRINSKVKSFNDIPGVYVSLNRTQQSIEEIFRKKGIDTSKLFFIDCVSSEKTRNDVLHISPAKLDVLSSAIKEFVSQIKGEKFIVVDALSTLLIYNNEAEVVQFVKEMTDCASTNNAKVIAFSPRTKGEELLDKIFDFFEKVEK